MNKNEISRTPVFNSFNIVLITLLLGIAVFPLFTRLDKLPIRLFDESRYAINSYEMARSNDFLVTTYLDEPDMWGTKPPFVLWCQVLFIKFLGDGELAIRLPSAIAGLLCCLVVFGFLWYYAGASTWGFMSAVILVSSHGFVNLHGTRTGDLDAILALFTTCYLMTGFLFIHKKPESYRYWYVTCIFIILAVLSKGVAGLLFLPPLIIYSWVQGTLKSLLKSKNFYIGVALISSCTIGYYVAREFQNPGYIKVVFQNEWGGRYFEVNEGHDQPWYYYLKNLRDFQFEYFYLLFFAAYLLTFFVSDVKVKTILNFSYLCSIFFLIVISISKTKLEWYDVPLYPWLSIISGSFFYLIFLRLHNHFPNNLKWIYIGVTLLFITIVYTPYRKNFKKNFYPSEYEWEWPDYQMSNLFRASLKGKENLDGYGYCYSGYHAHVLYYLNLLRDKGQIIPFRDYLNLVPGERVIVSSPDIDTYILTHYKCKKERVFNHIVNFYTIE